MTRYETVFDINVDINIVCSKNHISGNLVRIWLQLLVPSSVHRRVAKIHTFHFPDKFHIFNGFCNFRTKYL